MEVRLVARIPGELIRIDPVRNDLRRFRTAMLALGDSPWYILEPMEAAGECFCQCSDQFRLYAVFCADICAGKSSVSCNLIQ